MDYEKIIIDKTQLKILKLLTIREYANKYQIHGYLNFPSFLHVVGSIQDLEKLELIYKREFPTPPDYSLTSNGDKYLLFLKRSFRKKIPIAITALGGITTILGFLLKYILNK